MSDINKYLKELSSNKTREGVLNVSREIMQTIGIKAEERPKVLVNYTETLKKFLVENPVVKNQYHVYQLSTPEQNISCRLAVLKKINKRSLHRLCYHEMSGKSWQHTVSVAYQSLPYTIDFVTTNEFDKITVVITQGEQIRIIAFKDKISNLQKDKILPFWYKISEKPKKVINSDFWHSLDLKQVNKEFYEKIFERYSALFQSLKLKLPNIEEIKIKQFVIRLTGRYLFCWFLKEKGIIHPDIVSSKTINKTPDYYKKILIRLFFNTLNTKIPDRDYLWDLETNLIEHFKKIPYLNGGLFEINKDDSIFENYVNDEWLRIFVTNVLEEYHFTVDESSTTYQQVAIDPEMLGRIFENLLASQNPETEKLANQRKAFGAFYTPREIVEYMVAESLKLQLANKLDVKAEILEPLLKPIPVFPDSLKKYKDKIEEILNEIKILDPACGSGAFPMGILHKMIDIYDAIGTKKTNYELKKQILSNNIHGVDIMPMATEISRLRAWLSLIVDDEYKPNEIKNNFNIKALPNLDFKFVCANTLISLGLDDYLKKQQNKLSFFNDITDNITKLEHIRVEYFKAGLNFEQKKETKDKFNKARENFKKIIGNIGDKEDKELKEIGHKISEWNPFDDSKPAPFYSNSWMFGVRDGFDVVIGNPPYIQLQDKKKLSREIVSLYAKQKFKTFIKTGDIYCLFYEKGMNLLKPNCFLTFITSNKWLKSGYGKLLRDFLVRYTNPKKLIDFGGYKVFESAAVDTNILLIKNAGFTRKLKALKIYSDFNGHLSEYFNANNVYISNLSLKSWNIGNEREISIIEKIDRKGKILKEQNVKIYRGLITGFNQAFIIDTATKEKLCFEDYRSEEVIKPLLRGKDISKYSYQWLEKWLIVIKAGWTKNKKGEGNPEVFFKNSYPAIYNHLKTIGKTKKGKGKGLFERDDKGDYWWELRPCIYYDIFEKKKIIYPDITEGSSFAYCHKGIYLNNTCYIINNSSKYLLSVLNSKLILFYTRTIANTLGGKGMRSFTQHIEKLPIPNISEINQKPFIHIVDRILKIKQSNQEADTSALETQIDLMVYKLYELTYEEVKVVDSGFGMSEEEYEEF